MGNQKGDTREDAGNAARQKSYQRSSVILTVVCMASSLFALANVHSAGFLIPAIISGIVHLLFGLTAIVFTLQSGSFLRNIWIYAYFAAIVLVFGWMTGINESLEKKFDRKFNSDEYELYTILEPLALLNTTVQAGEDSAVRRAMALVKQGADPTYVFPGDSRSIAALAVSADVPQVVRLMLDRNPKLSKDPGMMEIMMRKAIRFGRSDNIDILLNTGVHFPLSRYKNDFQYSPGFEHYPEKLPRTYLRFEQYDKSRNREKN